jgi:hypothetical protein
MAVNINGTGSITGLSSISSPGISGVPVGSASAPAFSFTGDTNTGIYSPGADQVAVATNGTGQLFISSLGNIGIGAASPSAWSYGGNIAMLGAGRYIASTSDDIRFASNVYTSDVERYAANGFATRYRMSDGTHQWATAVTGTANNAIAYNESMRITAAGLVGIGSFAPQGRFESAAGDSTDYAIVANNSLSTGGEPNYISLNSGATRIGSINRSVNDIALKAYFGSVSFWTGTGGTATQKAVIDSSGRVGIGTTSPGHNLHVFTDSAGVATTVAFESTQGSAYAGIFAGNSYTADLRFGDFTALRGKIQAETDDSMSFYSGGVATERARIDSSGRLGIGTSSVGALLHASTAGTVSALNEISRIESTAANSGPSFTFYGKQGSDASTKLSGLIGFTQTQNSNSDGRPAFVVHTGTNGSVTEKLRVTHDGLVGIGTTPDSPLHVVGTSGTGLRIGYTNNTNYFDANTQIFRSNNATTTYGQWDSSGRLLVGTSSSSGPALLQVAGNTIPGVIGGFGILDIRHNGFPANGDAVGTIRFQSETNDGAFASITAVADSVTAVNDYPGRLTFSTTADGASSPTERMRIEQSGNIRFMNTGLVFPLTDNAVSLGLNGYRWTEVWAANGTIQTSDQRAKTDITSATLGSDFVKSLRPVSYRWVEGGKVDSGNRDEDGNYIYESVPGTRTHWGFIAQEVKQAVDATGVDFGGWLLTDKDDPDSQQALRYDQFIAPLTKALQEAIAKIETLEGMVAVNNITIDEQQHQLSTLAARLTALETP